MERRKESLRNAFASLSALIIIRICSEREVFADRSNNDNFLVGGTIEDTSVFWELGSGLQDEKVDEIGIFGGNNDGH